MGVRRLRALLKGLPAGSALHRELDPGWSWTFTDELLAGVIEVLDYGNRMYFAAHKPKGAQVPKPITIRRPWDPPPEKPEPATFEEVTAFFGQGQVMR